MKPAFKYLYAVPLALLLAACAEERFDSPVPDDGRLTISLRGSIDQTYAESRVSDDGFADGDAVGVYIVDYTPDGDPQTLLAQGNNASNVKFKFDEDQYTWTSSTSVYWHNDHTPADAYSYYPYINYIPDVNACPFEVQTRQDREVDNTSMGGFEASDFLWAKTEGAQPGQLISLLYGHVMSSVQVRLLPGEGFDGSWLSLPKEVKMLSTITASRVDLATGEVTVDTDAPAKVITPMVNGSAWRAVVVPQTVAANTPLLQITVDGMDYKYSRPYATTYRPGKMHKYTIRVDMKAPGDYAFTLVDEAITPWEADAASHQSVAKVYTLINVPEPGGLAAAVAEAGIIKENVINLKITGTLNCTDFAYLGHEFPNCIALNLKEIRSVDIPLSNWYWDHVPFYGILEDRDYLNEWDRFDDAIPMDFTGVFRDEEFRLTKLTHLVLPDHCKYIGLGAFGGTKVSGTLVIPEGCLYIGSGAFGAASDAASGKHITQLILPSTLKTIGDIAFSNAEFSNELILPDGLEYLGEYAFDRCRETYGVAHLPASLRHLGEGAFREVNITGIAVFPDGIKTVTSAFGNTQITSVYIPDGVEEIGEGAFVNTLSCDLHIPNSVKKIGPNAFAHTKLNHVNIPTSLEIVEARLFSDCHYLMDSIVIPEGVRRINGGAFSNCSNLSTIIIPSTVDVIEGGAFVGCYSLEELRCDAVVPPTTIGDPFSDLSAQVHKDNFTLVVPEGSVEAYQQAEYWREFKRIAPQRNLVMRPQLAKVLNAGGKREVVLNADAGKGWTVTHCPDWMHISATKGTGKTSLTVTIDPMEHGSPMREDFIEVRLDGTECVTTFKASQYDYEYDEDESYIINSHTVGGGVDLVIVGDGYDAEDISNGKYLSDMHTAAEQFFDVEPYRTYRDYFNVYTAFALSYESGIGSVNYLRNVKFGTEYGNGNYDSRIKSDFDAAALYCLDNTPVREADFGKLTCIVVTNSEAYDGITLMYSSGTAVALCPKSTARYPNDARGLIQHEAGGHAFGKLADEYVYHKSHIDNCPCVCCEHADGLESMHAMGWGFNLWLKGTEASVPWRHMLCDSRVNDIVDIYEGGFFHQKGVYRSEYNSCMNNNVPYYSTWSRELIVRRIMDYAGVTYDYEAFIANDSREWGRDFTLGGRALPSWESAPLEGRHPIIVNGAPKRKKSAR